MWGSSFSLQLVNDTMGSASDYSSRGNKFEFQLGHIIIVEIDHEIISGVILALPLVQEGHVSYWPKDRQKYWLTI